MASFLPGYGPWTRDATPTAGPVGLHADNFSWAPSFVLGSTSTKGAGSRAGSRTGLQSGGGAAANAQYSSLDSPAYLLKRRDNTFLQVVHPEPAAWSEASDEQQAQHGREPSEATAAAVEKLRTALLKQMHRVIDLFRKLDANNDGRVTASEFRRVLPIVNGAPTDAPAAFGDADADALYSYLDQDRSGSIEYAELQPMLRQGLNVNLADKDKRLLSGAVALPTAGNKIALRGSSGGDGGKAGGSGAATPGVPGEERDETFLTSTAPEAELAQHAEPSQQALAPASPPPASAGSRPRQLLVSAPVIGPMPHLANFEVQSKHAERTWYTLPGQSSFVLQPPQPLSVLFGGSPSQPCGSPSRLQSSVALARKRVDLTQAQAHHAAHVLEQRSQMRVRELHQRRQLLASPERLRRGQGAAAGRNMAAAPQADATLGRVSGNEPLLAGPLPAGPLQPPPGSAGSLGAVSIHNSIQGWCVPPGSSGGASLGATSLGASLGGASRPLSGGGAISGGGVISGGGTLADAGGAGVGASGFSPGVGCNFGSGLGSYFGARSSMARSVSLPAFGQPLTGSAAPMLARQNSRVSHSEHTVPAAKGRAAA